MENIYPYVQELQRQKAVTSRHESTGQKSTESSNPIGQSLTNGNSCNGNNEHHVSTRTEVEEMEVSQNEPAAHTEAVTEDKKKDYTTYPALGTYTVCPGSSDPPEKIFLYI